nr:hypothetical protein CFP56_64164 [Quercus suber]
MPTIVFDVDGLPVLKERKQLQAVLEGQRQVLVKNVKRYAKFKSSTMVPDEDLETDAKNNSSLDDEPDTITIAEAIATHFEASTAMDNEFECELNQLLEKHGLQVAITPVPRLSKKRAPHNDLATDDSPAVKRRVLRTTDEAVADVNDAVAGAEEMPSRVEDRPASNSPIVVLPTTNGDVSSP